MFGHTPGPNLAHQASSQHQDLVQQHETMQHHQQATQAAQMAHQQLEAMHQEAVQQHFQALLTPQPAGQRFLSLGRFVFAVLDSILGD
jgi:hypothetical protein